MRSLLLLLPLGLGFGIAGCAGTQTAQRTTSGSNLPVVSENPSLFERNRAARQEEAKQEMAALTEVQGEINR